ncbi:ABC transporter substrate-binding protein [Marinobacter sp. F4206]|uniref:ABC transporter substrate-binding protein n=1 Tax=Marinobacter sp. F4206 TaxID=2861777 RepID=UPI001C605D4B|nr:ABC transporter substrate-binding protein [Marinobacter sp. F4206]MBW4933087.1 ABC transporter substrate-binding protein [Marinobacter sp. F4206]
MTSVNAQEASNRTVYLAGSGNTALDQHVQALLEERLGDNVGLATISDEQIPMVEDTPVVAIGPSAFSRVRQANRSAPILAMLVEKSFIDGFAAMAPGQISGVLYDVPLLRQALTGKAILPHANTISILATTNSVELYEPLIDELPAHGMKARVFVVDNDEDLIPSLVRALGYGDFLLAGPDDAIYNPRTIKHILLTAYRRNKIVIGPSQAYVRAGALASSYAPFPAMADLGVEFIDQFLATGKFPKPAYSPLFQVEINNQVARSLNIPVPDREYINQYVQDALTGNGGPEGE